VKYIELSIKELREKSNELAFQISKSYKPDVVLFIAKGAYLIGDEISRYYDIPLLEITAERNGGKAKEVARPVLKFLPKELKIFLRKLELKSGFHTKNNKRNIYLKDDRYLIDSKNILIVDDSIDSGNTSKDVFSFIKGNFPNSNVKFAVLNYFEKSTNVFRADYFLYKDTIIMGPMSKDSKEYGDFLNLYNSWTSNEANVQKSHNINR